jgi:hypothetical protein
LVDVFAVDVLDCGRGGIAGFLAAGVFLFKPVEFESRLEFGDQTHLEREDASGDGTRVMVMAVCSGSEELVAIVYSRQEVKTVVRWISREGRLVEE